MSMLATSVSGVFATCALFTWTSGDVYSVRLYDFCPEGCPWLGYALETVVKSPVGVGQGE